MSVSFRMNEVLFPGVTPAQILVLNYKNHTKYNKLNKITSKLTQN